jgi:hypothetical protein
MTRDRPKVRAADLPVDSDLHGRFGPGDFLDCYRVRSDLAPREAASIITDFPDWAQILLVIRRMATAPFGLSTDGPEAADKIGVFPVESESRRELIAGFNDRHLDFRISVFAENGFVHLATWVHTHNLGGRVYLKAILPFHVLIARDALARVGRHGMAV